MTVMGQLKRLYDLSAGAEEAGQFSAAINAEKIRSALGGLTVDRRENIHQLDDLSREEITSRLNQLRREYSQAFIEGEYIEVTDADTSRPSATWPGYGCVRMVAASLAAAPGVPATSAPEASANSCRRRR